MAHTSFKQIKSFKTLCIITKLSLVLVVEALFLSTVLKAEPWVDTRDLWLRQDIELLADAGIIKTPITTYPLMWANIVSDIDHTDIDDVPDNYRDAFWRVRKKMQSAFNKRGDRVLRLSAATASPVFRSFGDTTREEGELSARASGVSDNWAWNTELTYVSDAYDGESVRPDGSYLAGVLGNWVVSAGWVEKWWGPTWSSADLISNNARPSPALMLQRNYALPFESNWLSWIGPWNFNTFIGQLDDERTINNAYHFGASLTFKPARSVEVGLRRAAQWGGDDRPDSISSFFDLLVGRDNCGSADIVCEDDQTEPGNQLAGVDVRWTLPIDTPSNIYLTTIGEDEAGYMPAKRIHTLGLSSTFNQWGNNFRWYVEYSDTAVWQDEYNVTYEHGIYLTGYRYHGRAIGSTYDNDSQALVLGVMGQLSNRDMVSFRVRQLDLNRDGDPFIEVRNSITDIPITTNNLSVSWQHEFINNGTMKVNLDYFSEEIVSFGRDNGQVLLSLDWEYLIE